MPPRDRARPAHLQLLAVAWNFGWPVAAGVVLGHWIDQSLGSSPAATLGLGIGSMAASVWRLLRLSAIEIEERKREEAEGSAEAEARRPRGAAARAPFGDAGDSEAPDEEALLDELLEQRLDEERLSDDADDGARK